MTRELLSDPALDLANAWQRNFPLCNRPYATLGKPSGLTEGEVLDYLQSLADRRILGRIGAAVRPNTIGASTLAAMAVPQESLNEVAEAINSIDGVNHNYEREHAFNLWFVVTAPDRGELSTRLRSIAVRFEYPLLDLPLERAYHIDLGFSLAGTANKRSGRAVSSPVPVSSLDRAMLAALEGGLPLVAKPYKVLAGRLGISEADLLARLDDLIRKGVISRFGCILRHRVIGYRANAMAVWDVPDDRVDAIAERLAAEGAVTLCYRRARRKPDWPFNLFAMIHGRDRSTVRTQIKEAALASGLAGLPSAVLFSKRCYKQSVARYSDQKEGALR